MILAAEFDIIAPSVSEWPTWVVVLACGAVAVIAAGAWYFTRRKGPPPLPRR